MKENRVRYSLEEKCKDLYRVRMDYKDEDGRKHTAYVYSSYKGNYKWTISFGNANAYSKATAEKHLEALRKARRNETRKNH